MNITVFIDRILQYFLLKTSPESHRLLIERIQPFIEEYSNIYNIYWYVFQYLFK